MSADLSKIGILSSILLAATVGVSQLSETKEETKTPVVVIDHKPSEEKEVQTLVAKPDPRIDKLIVALNNLSVRQADYNKSVDDRLTALRTNWKPVPAPAVEKRAVVMREPEVIRVSQRGTVKESLPASSGSSGSNASVRSNCSGGSTPPTGGNGNTFTAQSSPTMYPTNVSNVFAYEPGVVVPNYYANRSTPIFGVQAPVHLPFSNGLMTIGGS